MAFTLPPLPYAEDALAPHVSAETLRFHHGKHHKAYVDKANAALEGSTEAFDEVGVIQQAQATGNKALFNNAAQAWNHSFLWNSYAPDGGGRPTGTLGEAIDRDFGSYDAFAEEFTKQATGHFGSGWAWLVHDGGKLKITTTHDGDTPVAHQGEAPLLTLDLWEHAYYLDYQNGRPDYVKAYLAHLINWRFAETNMAVAA